MKLTADGIYEIKKHEGLRLKAYPDPGSRDGHPWTIGYGHTSLAGPPEVVPGMKITRSEADTIFDNDIRKFAEGVRKLIKVELNDNQFSAFVSFAYNIGLAGFAKSSALRAANAGNFDVVPAKMALWNKNDGRVMQGLVNRRAAEGRLFMTPVDGKAEPRQPTNHVEPSAGKPLPASKTAKTAVAVSTLGGIAPAAETARQVSDLATSGKTVWESVVAIGIPVVMFICIVAMGVYIIYERNRHSKESGV